MIDIYGVIVVGSALIIGFIPLMSKKWRGADFLIVHVGMTLEEEEWYRHHKEK